MTKERNKLLNLGMKELFIKLAIPSMLGMLVVGLYNLADAFFVGQYVGKAAVGAVALIYISILFNQAIFYLVGSGAGSLLSISIGKKDKHTINKILPNLLILAIILSGIYSIISFIFAKDLVSFFGATGEIHTLATEYLKIISLGFIPAAIGPAMNFLVRGEGKMKQAMIMMSIPGILNIILDGILIGLFNWGIKGAAIATITSQIVFAIIQLSYFKWGNKSIIKLKSQIFKIDKLIISKIVKVGMPQFIMLITAMIQQIILFKLLAHYGGNDHISLMGATYRIFMFAYLIIWGFGAGLQPVVGVNYGAKQYDRIKKAFSYFTKISLIVSSITWLCFMLFSKELLGGFIQDTKLIENCSYLFLIFNSIFFAYAFFATMINFFIGIGNSKEAGILMISRQIFFFIPLALLLPMILGVSGVWVSMPLADGLTIILAFYLRKKVVKKELNAPSVN